MARLTRTRLAQYEITSFLGAGGMGEVYRARDERLGREVALKVLPAELAADRERVARFEREARLLASLNHPHVATLHGFETDGDSNFLVMELVSGETLAERMARGPLPVGEALNIADQIADGLVAAHQAGVIHRDLKPANVKVSEDGDVKILDFGLARTLEEERRPVTELLSDSPTLTEGRTRVGQVLGTPGYMAPEQARGQPVDRRADVWAFGAIVYEMLTGRRAFSGRDLPDTVAATLRDRVELDELPAACPPRIRKVVELCLEREPSRRIHDMADVRLAMAGAFETTTHEPTRPAVWPPPGPLLAIAMLVIATTALVVWSFTRPRAMPADPADPMRLTLVSSYRMFPGLHDLAISRDGRAVVYTEVTSSGIPSLRLRHLDRTTSAALKGGEGGVGPFFSPDGRWLGMVDFAGGNTLSKVSIYGGSPVTLLESATPIRGAAWGEDGRIVIGSFRSGLRTLSENGGEPGVLTIPEGSRGEINHSWPSFVPDRSAVVFVISSGIPDTGQLATLDLESGQISHLGIAGTSPRVVPSGHLLWAAEDGWLRAVGFDIATLSVSGTPVPLIENVAVKRSGAANFSVSDNGRLIYCSASASPGRHLVWIDRDGNEEVLPAPRRDFNYVRLSPDGSRIAADIRGRGVRLWIWDIATETLSPATSGPYDIYGTWHPDGRSLIFSSSRAGAFNVYRKAADGLGTAQRVTESSFAQAVNAITGDGAWVIVQSLRQGRQRDLVMAALDDGVVSDDRIKTLLATAANEGDAALSPDGEWLALESDVSDRFEIYVHPFPDVESARIPVSTTGGEDPVWSRDGKELFYVSGSKMMVAPVETDPSFSRGTPRVLFEADFHSAPGRTYDVAPDGRFLVVKAVRDGGEADEPTQIAIVLDWPAELERRSDD